MIVDTNKKKRKVSHLYITDKKPGFGRLNKFYSDNDPLMRSENNRTNKILKPIKKPKMHIMKQHSIKTSYSKETSLGKTKHI